MGEWLNNLLKSKGHVLSIIIATLTISLWLGVKVRELELFFHKQFDSIEKRFQAMEKRDDDAWTIQMQTIYGNMTARHNSNMWVPSSLDIHYGLRHDREPADVRVLPP